ncbi:MAG: tetratricopeptide repeat protein [Vicinamibacterales bacterium]|nr:tetratricopeptide repeat protein [Vicinamibacterales bacterium]
MRRPLLLVLVVAAVAGAAALAWTAVANEQEYQRLIEAGDRSLAADLPFPALEAYSGAIALQPDAMLAHLKRGITYHARGELDEALRDLRRASELDPAATQPLELTGDVYAALARHDRAADRYEAYLALDDRSARVLYKLALARYRHGSVDQAIAPLRDALALDPSMAEAQYLLGLCLRDVDRLDEAREALEALARQSPGMVAAREALADVYARLGDGRRTMEQLEALTALEPERPERLIAVGFAHAQAGRHDAAVVTLGRAIDRWPEAPRTYAALGQVWLDAAEARGDRVALVKALEALTMAASRADAGGGTLMQLGRAWLLAGDVDSAERYLRQAVARQPAPPDAYRYLAQAAERLGRIDQARDALLRYATLVGDTRPLADVSARIARFSLQLEDPYTAAHWLDRAMDEAGPTVPLLTQMAEAQLALGRPDEARRVIEDGLGLEPTNRQLLTLRRRLPPSS